ncbi:isoleucine--tRNA ligase [Patescibacteria group bacterium]
MAKKNGCFEPVEPDVDFVRMENDLLKLWYEKGIVKKYLQKNSKSRKYFSFLDGPITANGPMGVHHAWGRTYKDLFQRFKNMQGFRQRFQNGFDAQGLWVEVEVEKELGFKNKKEIEDFGVAKFVQLCKDRVKKFSDIQTQQSKRLGYFMDWENSYFTLSDDNNYMIWRFLKTVNDNGWLYKGNGSVAWCPRCETAISQHEMLTEDYKEVTHKAVYFTYPVVGAKNQYLLVWTTTPWTIPANIAVAVDKFIEYSLVEVNKKGYWVAKDTIKRAFKGKKFTVLKTVRGSKLVGLKYTGAFDSLPKVKKVASKNLDKFHSVIQTDPLILPITTDEGTGLVHTAVSAGSEDFALGKKYALPMIPVIEDNADYMKGLGFLSGKNAKDNPDLILNYMLKLEEEGKHFILRIEDYKHRYPACWRCKAELVWKVTDEWYIAMDKGEPTLRQRMIEVAKKIDWIPSFGLKRELDWLENMHDWLISKKNRYWGLTLPIWECSSCGNFDVMGSKEELKKCAVEGWTKLRNKSPHKPQIDLVKIKCSKCGALSSRIEPVGNPWLDAGIVAYSTVSKNNKSANFETNRQKPLYLSDKDTWDKWIPADLITESFPGQFKNWFYSLIAMSTVLEDINPAKSVFGYATLLSEDGRPMHKSWGNMIEFNDGADKIGIDVMRWMYIRQNPIDNILFGFKSADEVRRKFHLKLWNIYNFFVTYANLDGYNPQKSSNQSVKSNNVLDKWILSRLKQTVKITTSNLEKYKAHLACFEIENFVDDFSLWYIRRSRERVGPAAENQKDKREFYKTTYYVLKNLSYLLAPFVPFMSEFMYTNLTSKESVHLEKWSVAKSLKKDEKKLFEDMSLVRDIVEKAHAIRKEKKIALRQPLGVFSVESEPLARNLEKLIKDEVNVKKIIWNSKTFKLDTKITKELEEEAKARELVREIQAIRKEKGMNLTQKINVISNWIPTNNNLVQWVVKKAQIANLSQGKKLVIKKTS